MYALRRLKVITVNGIIEDGYIVIDRGKIIDVGREPLEGFQGAVEYMENNIATPGFVDTHIHGIEGLDPVSDPSIETYLEMSSRLVKYGVTSFVPTTVTAPHEAILSTCRSLREAKGIWKPEIGARILGLHLEGPYISREMAGAQNPVYIKKPDIGELREYIEASGHNIVQVTIAPEIEGSMELLKYCRQQSIVVSAGHTNASYDEGIIAIRNGVTKATHLFNGMRRIHHRDPGITLALIENTHVYLELIVDLIHVHPAVVRHVINYAGSDRVVLITDAIAATGLEDGFYELGGLKIKVEKGIARLVDKDILAGSTLTMINAFKNTINLGFNVIEVSKMTSTTPVRSLGLESKLRAGKIARGYLADIVILDEKYEVRKVYVEGRVVYEK